MARPTLAEQAFSEIRRRILTGELPAGERLVLEDLARDLDVSMSPVKEALRQLESCGLVEIHPRRGTNVRLHLKQDARDVFEARLMLEPEIVAKAVAGGPLPRAVLAELDAAIGELTRLRDGTRFRDIGRAVAADGDFHRAIARATGNRVLVEMYGGLIDRAHLVRNFSTLAPRAEATIAEHRAIRDALAGGDPHLARDAAVAHIRAVRSMVMEALHTAHQRSQTAASDLASTTGR